MRSNDFAITARTPSNAVPFAAQSRDDPEPYSAPAKTIKGTPSDRYRAETSNTLPSVPSGRCTLTPPSDPGTSLFRSRMFANVPRTITSWFPRREP